MDLHEILCSLPALYSTESIPWDEKDKPIRISSVRLPWEWIPVEYDPVDRVMFGMVHGFESELGYTSLDDLLNVGAFVVK